MNLNLSYILCYHSSQKKKCLILNNKYSATDNSLLILQLIVNGFKNHLLELESVLKKKRIITETRFIKYPYIRLPGYTLIKTNHPDGHITPRMGVLLYLLNNPQLLLILYQTFVKIFFNLVLSVLL